MGLAPKTLYTCGNILRSGKALPVLFAGVVAGLSASAYAAAPVSVDPSQVEKRFERETPRLPESRVQTVAPQDPGLPKEVQSQLAKKQFVLKRVDIEGNTAFTDEELKFAYSGMLGKQISLLDVQTIAKNITSHYRGREYILSQAIIPSQDIGSGTLKIRVLEGYIGDVRFEGDIKGDTARKTLESYGAQLKSKKPIRISELERYLLLMDDLPGSTAKGLVRPSTKQVGAADLVVTISHDTFNVSYTADNRGSETVGPFQHSVILVGNSLLGAYDRTMLRMITTSPTTELRFIDLQHEQQIGDEGTRLVMTGSYSHTEPGDFLQSLDIESDSTFFQGKVIHPFLRSRPENLLGRIMFDMRNTQTDFGNLELSEDKIRAVRLGGNYDFADKLGGVNLFDAEISQGLDIFGATDINDNPSRADMENDFTKISFDVTRTQPLPRGFSLYMAATSQYSFDRLLGAEQFTVGGANFGRAYDSAEITGDHGVAGKVELRYGQTMTDPLLQSYQVYGFYDVGRAWLEDTVDGDQSLAAAGAGVRTNFSENLSGDFQVAFPLTREASNQGNHAKDARLFFTVTARY